MYVFLAIHFNWEEGGARNIKIDIKKAKNIQNMFDYTNHIHTKGYIIRYDQMSRKPSQT